MLFVMFIRVLIEFQGVQFFGYLFGLFSRKEAFAITNIIWIAYVYVANHNCDMIVAVDADADPFVRFKSPVTYTKHL